MMTRHRIGRAAVAVLAVLTGAVTAAVPAQAAAQPATRYIVSLRSTFGLGADSLDDAATRLAGDDVNETLPEISGFTATLTPRIAATLAANPAVAAVEPDGIVRISGTQTNPPWNLDRIDQRSTARNRRYVPLSSAATVHAYVIDTGVDVGHPDFDGRAVSGYDFVDNDHNARDCSNGTGHGTHVAGTIGGGRYGVAKGIKLVAVRVLGCAGSGSTSGVIKGINWVTSHAVKPAVANLSLGGSPSTALEAAVRKSIASGVTYAIAGGNDSTNACRTSPARVVQAITVGATNASDSRASFSNYGACLDLFAPGVGVESDYPGYRIATMSGTSMASPAVAGAAAMLLAAQPTLTPAQVAAKIIANSTKNTVRYRGSGSPNRVLFTTTPPAAAAIAVNPLPDATAGAAYSRQLYRSGGTLTGSWTALNLPAGMTLSRSGLLAGTPTDPGTHGMTVRFTDFVPRTASRTITLKVN